MKKTWNKIMGLVLVISLVGIFTGCPKPTGTPESEPATYTISADKESLELVAGGDAETVEITTNGTLTVEVENEAVATAVIEGSKVVITPVAAGSTTVVVTLKEDATKTVEIPVVVTKSTMILTLTLEDAVAVPGGSITVLYGNGGDTNADAYEYYASVDAVVAEDGKSATVELNKAKANEWGWFNGIKITVKDAEDKEVAVTYYTFFEFSADGVTLELKAFKAATMTVTIKFQDFTATEAQVTYGYDDKTETVDAVVAEDGKSATFEVSNEYINGSSWTNLISVVAKNGEETLNIEFKGEDTWFEFNADNKEQKMPYALKADWTAILDGEVLAGTGSFSQVLTADDFAGKTITALRVIAADAAEIWWSNCSYADDWDVDIEMAWNDEYKGYSTDIEDADYIAKIVENGLYMVGGYTKVYVLYK